MAAGDISDALLVTLRTKLNEASAGFWTDAQLFDLMTSSQREIIDILLKIQRERKRLDPDYEHPSLRSVIKIGTVSTSAATSLSFSAIVDIHEIIGLELYNSTPRWLKITLIPYTKLSKQRENGYMANSYSATTNEGDIYAAIVGTTAHFSGTLPNSDFATLNVIYVYTPAAMTTSVDPVLNYECYEPLIYIAYSKALMKDGREAESQVAYSKALNLLV